ncbi:MAG: zinc transporter ZupT [Bacteroidales bacterium]|nr:zinc transporter ZupT [Bacteroidales bacterium]
MEVDSTTLLIAFGLTLFAGLSTGIGSAIGFFAKRTNTKFLAVALGFSAGVMIYISFVEIFFEARISITEYLITDEIINPIRAEVIAQWHTVTAFFIGMLLIAIIDKLVPSYENPHEIRRVEELSKPVKERKLMRMGMFTALVIAIHNFPEGIATFMAAIQSPSLGIPIAIAIAIHNIPEGIAVSVPIYYATGSRKKAFWYSFSSGLAEPVGAAIGYLILMPFMNKLVFGYMFASVAGIMVFISLVELLPSAREYGKHHLSIYGLILGMAVMAISLVIMA